jgi:hypothetical protein
METGKRTILDYTQEEERVNCDIGLSRIPSLFFFLSLSLSLSSEQSDSDIECSCLEEGEQNIELSMSEGKIVSLTSRGDAVVSRDAALEIER